MRTYDTSNYAQSRLAGTIVRLNKEPITVIECFYGDDDDLVANYRFLKNGRVKTSKIIDFDLTPVPLGFCDTRYGASYLTRVPKRSDYRQGLRSSNYMSVNGASAGAITKTNLRRTILGQYRDLDAAMDELENSLVISDNFLVPFSRDFAVKYINGTPSLSYKWVNNVGSVRNSTPMLKPQFQHLQESMEIALNESL
jgi:hypothetical protein